MTFIPNEDNRHWSSHNHTHTEETKELHSTIFLIFFIVNICFQPFKGRFKSSEKYQNFTYVSSGMYLLTKYGKSGIKAVYNYKIKIMLLHRVDKM